MDGGDLARSLSLPATTAFPALLSAALQRFGPGGAARRVRGTVSWAAWDPRLRRLWICRDRMGRRPVVFARRGGRLVVGDDARAVLAAAGLAATVDLAAAVEHLHGRFPRAGDTYHRQLSSLPPGHLLEATPEGLSVARYWRVEPGRPLPEAEVVEAVSATLRRVVADHLSAEGTLLSLSGGLDTPTLAAVHRALHPDASIEAFTWTFPGMPEADEEAAAGAVARRLGLRHHRWPASARVTWEEDEDLEPAFDSPFCHYFEALWRRTFQRARRLGFRRLATGVGGDHLFGYGGMGAYAYPDLLLTGRWLTLGRGLAAHARSSPASLRRILDVTLARPLAHHALWAVLGIRRPPGCAAVAWLGAEGRRLLSRNGHAPAGARPPFLLPGRVQRLRMLRHGGVDGFLVEMGRRGAAHGVELCHPLLDSRLFELAARLPSTAFQRAGLYKPVLRDAMAGYLPAVVLERRRKATSQGLFDAGMRGRRRREVEELLTGMRAADLGLVDPTALRAAYLSYLDGGGDTRFWHALTLERWLRRHG